MLLGKGGYNMCYTCGCGQPYDDHGNPKNITEQTLKDAAQASGESVSDAKEHMEQLLDKEEDNNELQNPKKSYSV